MSRTQKDFVPRKEKLIQIALDQFLEKGYEDTTITDLQKAFELTKGGMYHYFSGKEEILDAVIEKGLGDLIDEWQNYMKDLPEKDRLMYVCFTNTANSFSSRLLQYGRSGESSIVTYKLREQRIKMLRYIVSFVITIVSLAVVIGICYNRCTNLFVPMWIHFMFNLVAPAFTGSMLDFIMWYAVFYGTIAVGYCMWYSSTKIQ